MSLEVQERRAGVPLPLACRLSAPLIGNVSAANLSRFCRSYTPVTQFFRYSAADAGYETSMASPNSTAIFYPVRRFSAKLLPAFCHRSLL